MGGVRTRNDEKETCSEQAIRAFPQLMDLTVLAHNPKVASTSPVSSTRYQRVTGT